MKPNVRRWDKLKLGGQYARPVYAFDMTGKLINSWPSLSVAADKTGIHVTTLRKKLRQEIFIDSIYYSHDAEFIIPEKRT